MTNEGMIETCEFSVASAVTQLGIRAVEIANQALFVEARRRARSLRAAGVHPAPVYETVVNSLVGGLIRDETFFAARLFAVREGIALGLADRPRPSLDPLTRQRDVVIEGVPITLADGNEWRFPRLDFERGFWQTPRGGERGGYLWEKREWGAKAGRRLPSLASAIRSSVECEYYREILRFCSNILRSHYSIMSDECSQLMPVDSDNPECVAGLMGLISDGGFLNHVYQAQQVAETIKRTWDLRIALLGYVAPLVTHFGTLGNDDDDCEESWAS